MSRASNRFWPLGEPLVPPHVDVDPPGQGGESPPGRPKPPDPDYGIEVTPPPEPRRTYADIAHGKLPNTFPSEAPAPRLQSLSRSEIKKLYVRHPNRNFAYNQHVTFKR